MLKPVLYLMPAHDRSPQVVHLDNPTKEPRRWPIQSPGQTVPTRMNLTHVLLTGLQVQYSANAARSDRRDPGRPVALDRSKGVPGLMTILKRI